MKAVKVFNPIQVTRFSLGQHVAFMQRIYDELISLIDRAGKLHIPDELMEEFKSFIDLENDLMKETKKLVNTSTRQDTDKMRDEIVVYLLQEIKNAARSPIATKQKAGIVLCPIADAYVGIQSEAQDTETVLIRGLIIDLKKSENIQYVTTLGLDEAIAKLEEVNEQYDRERKELSAKTKANKKANSREVRPQTDAVLRRILDLIYASELLCDEETGDLTFIEEEIDIINVIIDEFRARYNMSQAQKKANKDDDSGLEFKPVERKA